MTIAKIKKPWSRKYPLGVCKVCKTADHPHAMYGVCEKCRFKWLYHNKPKYKAQWKRGIVAWRKKNVQKVRDINARASFKYYLNHYREEAVALYKEIIKTNRCHQRKNN